VSRSVSRPGLADADVHTDVAVFRVVFGAFSQAVPQVVRAVVGGHFSGSYAPFDVHSVVEVASREHPQPLIVGVVVALDFSAIETVGAVVVAVAVFEEGGGRQA
jgi:hypothetical protein